VGEHREQASGRALARSAELGASLTFTFQGYSVDLIAQRGPDAGRLIVTLDGRAVPGLPVDAEGRTYLDLTSETVEWQARLPIARGLTSGQHVVRLTAGGASELGAAAANVDAFEVNAGQPPAFPAVPVAVLSFGLILVGGLLVRDLRRRPRREKFF